MKSHPATWPRALASAAEPFTLSVYFSSEARASAVELGLTELTSYFAQRAAPMGLAHSSVVAAAFHSFPESMFAEMLPTIWSATSPTAVLDALHASIPTYAARAFGGGIDDAELDRLGRVLADAVESMDVAGRPLAAANQQVPVPTEPWGSLWQTLNTLREYRGDGHIAVLVAADLDVVEAEVLTVAWGLSQIDGAALQRSRRVSDDAWAAGIARMHERGLLTDGGSITHAGLELRNAIEDHTDRVSIRPWNTLSASDCRAVYEFVGDLSTKLIDAKLMRSVTPVGLAWGTPLCALYECPDS